ncbi:MAG: hypothetical protein IT372_12760 [Polyangiaceae bacterium]|nr:hypothetical protein [Polyangiaceae bacterium]
MRTRDILRQIATLIAIPFGILMNVIPNGGRDIAAAARAGGETALTVAPYTFGIWYLIFLLQLAYMVYQLLPSQRESPVLRAVGWWAVVNSVAQGLWPVAILRGQQTLGWVLILIMLAALIVIEVRVGAAPAALRTEDRLLVRVPYSVNLGWISVATIIGAYSLIFGRAGLQQIGASGAATGEVVGGIIALLAAAGLGLLMLFRRGNIAYAAVIVWALIGAAVGSAAVPAIAWTATVLAAIVAVAIVAALVLRRTRGQASEIRA